MKIKNVIGKMLHSKNSIKSKQYALMTLSDNSVKVTNKIQTSIANLQATNSEIDATIKEIADMKTQYSMLEAELQARKTQNEGIIAMFSVKGN